MKKYIYIKASNNTSAEGKLNQIKEYDDEVVAEYTTTLSYMNSFYCLIDKDSDDISYALEDTLQRLVANNVSDDDIYQIMGVYIPNEENEDEMSYLYETGYIDIDLGYVLPGEITSFEKIEE